MYPSCRPRRRAVCLIRSGAAAVCTVILTMPAPGASLAAQLPVQTGPFANAQLRQADPARGAEQILRKALDRCDALDGYRIRFSLRERRGLFHTLSRWEHLQVDYRKDPTAIKMVWLDPHSEYARVLYVQGRNNGEMEVLPRHGFLGFSPHPIWTDPSTPVDMGKSFWPITDFGLAKLLRITLQEVQRARQDGQVSVTYAGQSSPPDLNEPSDHIVIRYPPGFGRAARQDLYISRRTGYPVAVYFREADNQLVAAYLYGPPELPAPPMSEFRLGG